MRSLTVRLPEEADERLALKAKQAHCSKAEYIRRKIESDDTDADELGRIIARQLPMLYIAIKEVGNPETALELECIVAHMAESISGLIDTEGENTHNGNL